MVLPITHYDSLRKERDRRRGKARGRPTSPAAMLETELMVYFIRFGDKNELTKVGRTSNIAQRMAVFEGASGIAAFCYAQLIVDTKDDMAALETHALDVLRCFFENAKMEWFKIPAEELWPSIDRIVASSPVPIKLIRGSRENGSAEHPIQYRMAHEVVSAVKYRMRTRGNLRAV